MASQVLGREAAGPCLQSLWDGQDMPHSIHLSPSPTSRPHMQALSSLCDSPLNQDTETYRTLQSCPYPAGLDSTQTCPLCDLSASPELCLRVTELFWFQIASFLLRLLPPPQNSSQETGCRDPSSGIHQTLFLHQLPSLSPQPTPHCVHTRMHTPKKSLTVGSSELPRGLNMVQRQGREWEKSVYIF